MIVFGLFLLVLPLVWLAASTEVSGKRRTTNPFSTGMRVAAFRREAVRRAAIRPGRGHKKGRRERPAAQDLPISR